MNTNTIVADLHQDVLKIFQDVSKICEDTGSRNKAVCDMYSPFTDFRLTLTAT